VRANVAFIALSFLVILFWITGGSTFMSARNWQIILEQLPVLLLVALAVTFVITAGYIDLSVGAAVGFAGMIAAEGALHFGMPGLLLGIVTGTLVGIANGSVFAFLRIPSFIVTLASMIILRAALSIVSGGQAVYTDQSQSGTVGWLTTAGQYPWVVIILVVPFIILWVLYNKTLFGQNLRAIGGSEAVVGLFGVPLRLYKVMVFGFVGLCVGIASIINLGQIGAASPQTGLGLELDAISAVVLGGTPLTGGSGSVTKTVMGALALVVLADGLIIVGVPPSWNDVVRGLLLITAIAIALDRRKIGIVK
jgi:ribose/xylose/arabinose/galactoside ABC-type transport system permease subunit